LVWDVDVDVSTGEDDPGMVGGMIVSRGGGNIVWEVEVEVSTGEDDSGT
jgi:hypothetical protein